MRFKRLFNDSDVPTPFGNEISNKVIDFLTPIVEECKKYNYSLNDLSLILSISTNIALGPKEQ